MILISLEASTLILEANGYEVITANNPITGFDIVKEKSSRFNNFRRYDG